MLPQLVHLGMSMSLLLWLASWQQIGQKILNWVERKRELVPLKVVQCFGHILYDGGFQPWSSNVAPTLKTLLDGLKIIPFSTTL